MTLKEYMKKRRISPVELAAFLGITRQQVHLYMTKYSTPSLETALILFYWSEGEVQLHEMLADSKRKRTKPGEKIVQITKWESDLI